MRFATFLKRLVKTVYLQVDDWILSINAYLNFDKTSGSSGHGLRSNNGIIEFKNLNGEWTSLNASVGGADWGQIGGTLSNQVDLKNALDGKENKLVYDEEIGALMKE